MTINLDEIIEAGRKATPRRGKRLSDDHLDDSIWIPAAKCASAVGTAQGFLQGVQAEYPSLPKHVRHAAGEIAKQIDAAWDEMRLAIEGWEPVAANHAVELAERLKRYEWRTIDSAPKDATDFLAIWDDDEMHVVCIRDGECYRAMDREPWMMPLYWMPLPEPPTP